MFRGKVPLKCYKAFMKRERRVCLHMGDAVALVNSPLCALEAIKNITLQIDMDITTQVLFLSAFWQPISSRHLIQYSQDVLSEARQNGAHRTASLCGCTYGGACVCVCLHASGCMHVYQRWILRHQGSGAIWCLAWHDKTCLEWDG